MEKAYDAFITYRGGPDAASANALYEILRRHELVPAIDSVDFSPTETFLDEMARCVRQSRFTIALISSRYATSHFPKEEAIMQQILDNREQQRRLIVVYIEDHPAPLWLQSRVGIRLFLDTEDTKPELKKLLRLLLLKADNPSENDVKAVEQKIDLGISQLPKTLLQVGVIGFAGYGVLSALADMDLDTTKDLASGAAGDVAADAVADHAEAASDHIKDHAQGAVAGVGRVVKNLLDDLF
jgi:hypothetical protein